MDKVKVTFVILLRNFIITVVIHDEQSKFLTSFTIFTTCTRNNIKEQNQTL